MKQNQIKVNQSFRDLSKLYESFIMLGKIRFQLKLGEWHISNHSLSKNSKEKQSEKPIAKFSCNQLCAQNNNHSYSMAKLLSGAFEFWKKCYPSLNWKSAIKQILLCSCSFDTSKFTHTKKFRFKQNKNPTTTPTFYSVSSKLH